MTSARDSLEFALFGLVPNKWWEGIVPALWVPKVKSCLMISAMDSPEFALFGLDSNNEEGI